MTAIREKAFLLARPEARALEWIARRLPRFVMPDHLTLLGVLAAGIKGPLLGALLSTPAVDLHARRSGSSLTPAIGGHCSTRRWTPVHP